MGAFDNEFYAEIIESLQYFGLEKMESLIYLSLLDHGPLTMSELATSLEVDRGKIYRSMDKLHQIGMISINNAKITSCVATQPEQALSNLIEQQRTSVTNLKKIKDKIAKELEQITRPVRDQNSPTISVIEGRNSIYARIGRLIHESKNPVYILTTTSDLLRMFQTAIPEKIKDAKNHNLQIKILVDEDDPSLSLFYKLGITEIRVGKLPSKSRIIVEKDHQLIMSGTIKNSNSFTEESESILYATSTEMTNNMFSLCEQIWKNAHLVVFSKS